MAFLNCVHITCLLHAYISLPWSEPNFQANLEPRKLNTTLPVQLEQVGETDNTGTAQSMVS